MRKLLTNAFICLIIFTACAPVTPTALPTPTAEPTATMAPVPTASPTPAPSPMIPPPTQTADPRNPDREMVLANATEMLEAFDQKLRINGWILKVFTRVYYDNMRKEYWPPEVVEEWYRLDEDGNRFAEGYSWLTTDGVVTQETLFQEGFYYNITYDRWSNQQIYEPIFIGDSYAQLEMGSEIKQEEVEYYGVKAWKFSSEFNDGGLPVVTALYFDKNSGLMIGSETYAVESDGSLLLVSGAVDQQWEIDAQPPLDRFEEMRDRAEKQSP